MFASIQVKGAPQLSGHCAASSGREVVIFGNGSVYLLAIGMFLCNHYEPKSWGVNKIFHHRSKSDCGDLTLYQKIIHANTMNNNNNIVISSAGILIRLALFAFLPPALLTIQFMSDGTISCQAAVVAGKGPSVRKHFSATPAVGTGQTSLVYLFGGRTDQHTALGDLYVFDVSTHSFFHFRPALCFLPFQSSSSPSPPLTFIR